MNRYLGIAAFVLSLLGLLWTTATKYQSVLDRLTTLEQRTDFYWGASPKGAK